VNDELETSSNEGIASYYEEISWNLPGRCGEWALKKTDNFSVSTVGVLTQK
jgi:hypothetical protein